MRVKTWEAYSGRILDFKTRLLVLASLKVLCCVLERGTFCLV